MVSSSSWGENSSGEKAASGAGVIKPVNPARISSGNTGVGDTEGVSVMVGVRVMVGVKVMVGVSVMVGVREGVSEGGKMRYATGSAY